ncbi:hypothetical protein CDAR_78841 [Caerostris darwini]|uniref:Uncharacterized protein n=1 Tax=Caerostris darwini TaxID=1538125 RepID=A0AAV4Q1W8_9ARAC|nr:hypothetical protein CDAR_78841 [Caerostris darwini]
MGALTFPHGDDRRKKNKTPYLHRPSRLGIHRHNVQAEFFACFYSLIICICGRMDTKGFESILWIAEQRNGLVGLRNYSFWSTTKEENSGSQIDWVIRIHFLL